MGSQIMHTVGRRWVNQILNGSTARPANLYMLLRQLDGNSGRPSDAAAADTLTSNLNEVSGAGYARKTIAFNATNFPESLSGADSVLTVAAQTFTFTGTFSGITHASLASTSDNTGVLIGSAPLSTTYNVTNGSQITVNMNWLDTQG
ncbi:MAG: hypothetical protein BGO01_20595 [Armatimonadetes bacterium 55-13]|nr:hypothetical protein [Armatimonadota bacterium]OJU64511.1 MAG: hypothetical protein BGO01_20595 [Armatimonadetes bacterium 55-13]